MVVDAKAAIRYLRHNDDILPGSSERIVITGWSGGGALSSIVGASGNSPDYFPYLKEIGAAGFDSLGNSTLNDNVFAIIAYCPITDFGNADIAYEWQYSEIREKGDPLVGPMGFIPWHTESLTEEMLDLSRKMKSLYPAYLASLNLKLEDGSPLTASKMQGAIEELVKASVNKALASGMDVPNLNESWTLTTGPLPPKSYLNKWLTHDGSKATNINYEEFLRFVAATAPLKGVPAFDVSGTMGQASSQSGESNLFGSDRAVYSNFTEWAWNNNSDPGDGTGSGDTDLSWEQYIAGSKIEEQLKLINPLAYLTDESNGDSAPYWYVRHGLRDRDTSFAIELELFFAIENDSSILDANYGFAYLQEHGAYYDVDEAYSWLANITSAAK